MAWDRTRRRLRASATASAVAAVLSTGTGPALAGAWTLEEGRGQVIATVGRDVSAASRFQSRSSGDESTILQVYGEYGLLDGFTLGGVGFLELADDDQETDGQAALSIFARKRVWRSPTGQIASVELGYLEPVGDAFGGDLGARNPDAVREVRLTGLHGISFWGDWGSAFVSSGAGYRWRAEGRDDEVHIDINTGYDGFECCRAFFDVFSTIPLGDQEDAELTLAPSVGYVIGGRGDGRENRTTLQFGVSQDVLDLEDGFGVQFSVWRTF